MHNKRYAARSLVLLAVLVSMGIFMRGLVDAAPPFTVSIESSTGQTYYLLGESVRLSGQAEFLSSDLPSAQVTLVIGGPQEVTQVLSVSDGNFSYPANNLEVTVTSAVITESSGTLPGGTLPAGTPCDCVRLLYYIVWSPPIFIDPAPEFVLIPQLSQVFGIPIVTPTAVAGEAGVNNLPDTVEKFAIPLVGTPEAGQPSALPGGEAAFAIPVIPTPTPDPNAPDPLPSLTTAFPVPAVPTPTSKAGAPPNLPTITEAFSVPVAATPTAEAGAVTALPTLSTVFDIPTAPTPTAVAGVAELPSTTEVFSIPNAKSPLGMTSDGTDFYVLVNGTPDQIYKVNATGTLVTAFGGGDGIVDVTFNADTRGSSEGIAYVGGNLYVADSEWRHETGDGYSLLKFDATTGAEADINAGDNSCTIPDFRRFTGLHADGTRLWGVEDYNSNLVKITTDCTQVTNLSVWSNSTQALAVGSGDQPFFFVSEGEVIVKRNKDDGSDTNVSFTLVNAIVKGLLYQDGLLYIADADSKKVLKANFPHGQTITSDPRGITYDGQYLYILVDASPKDKIIVVDPSDTSTTPAIVRSFDAPSSKADALTFADGFLWLAQEQGCCDREIKKLDRQAGNVAATITLTSPIHQQLGGLGYDGTNLVGFLKQFNNSFFTISKTNGDSTQVNVDFDSGTDGYQAATFRDTTDRAYAAESNVIYEFTANGEELTISARVTNTGSNRAVYPASLWINDTIEAARAINVGPGQTVPFQFTFRKPEGGYRVRVERLLGSFRVQSARVATATPAAEAAPAVGPEALAAPEPTATQTPAPPATPTTAPPIPPHATPTPAPTLTPTSAPTAAPRATPPPPAAAAAPLAPTPISVPAPAVPAAPAPPAKPIPAPEPEVVTPRERGTGVGVVIILGFIGAIAVAGAGVAIYLRRRGLQSPAAGVAPEGDEPPEAPADGPPAGGSEREGESSASG